MSIADDKLPIWVRPEPGDRKPRFTREAIAKAALAIADADGFHALSMRRIAERLGAGTMTLYHYVRTKAELVALMDDALMGEIVLPEGALPKDWREALTAIARRTREVFRRHPWALVSMQGALPGPNGARHFEQCLAALSRTSFDRRTKLEVLALVDDFVFGHVLRAAEVQSTVSKEPDAEVLAAIREWVLKQYETGAFPHTLALFGRAPAEKRVREVVGADDEEGRFERGLATLLDGIVQSRPRPARARRAKVNR
jgi:AcrR family transcriptional regulator